VITDEKRRVLLDLYKCTTDHHYIDVLSRWTKELLLCRQPASTQNSVWSGKIWRALLKKTGGHEAIFLKESRITGSETASNALQINLLYTEFCVELGWRQRDSSLACIL
jgi:hypothetical protein